MIKDDLLNTKDKLDAAASSFTDLIGSQGWVLLRSMVEVNIAILTDRIIQGGESEVETNRLRDSLQAYKDIINTPKNIIKQAQEVNVEEPSFDPYDKPKLDNTIE